MPTPEEMQAILDAPIELPDSTRKGTLEDRDPSTFEMKPRCVEFPEGLDNTTISAFRSCPQKAFRQYFQHLASSTTSIHLTAGAAFAKGLEDARNAFYLHNLPADKALLAGVRGLMKEWGEADPLWDHKAKSLDQIILAFVETLQVWPLGQDRLQPFEHGNRNGVEFSFAIPLPEVTHPVTGQPILYTGRIDLLGIMEGALFAEDDKTAGSLGAQWLNQWDLRSQFTGYAWALREYNLPAAGTIVRGVSPQKTGIKTSEVTVFQPDWKIDRWLEQTIRDVRKMIRCWEEGYWDYDLGEACNAYGGCPMKVLCNSANPEHIIPTQFVERKWDPLEKITGDKK